MDDFLRAKQQLRDARGTRDQAQSAVASLQQALKRLAGQRVELDRVFDPQNERHAAERSRLLDEQRRLEAALGRQRGLKADAVGREGIAIGEFTRFTDPRLAIERLNDATPILLMPVRLETRFKTSAPDPGAAPVAQLWVRVFPDDCWIDSFDPVLTENEVANAKAYWSGIWMAGGIEEQERAAWRGLAESHGSGRAAWIVTQFTPITPPDKPSKPRPQDIVLTIATETPLTAAEATAAGAFWKAMWLADGDTTKAAAAMSAFENASSGAPGVPIGAARATEIAATYVPGNFSNPLPSGTSKTQLNVSVAFVVFPLVDMKRSAWSQAPKATILPDRFVFVGYEHENDPNLVVVLGNHVPSPLLTGPDPAAAEPDQIRHDTNGNVTVPDELLWLSNFDRAVDVGMGFRINLTATQASRGFKRVLVVGLRLTSDEKEAKAELETLLRHHANSHTGLALVAQGTPTNNTEATNSGSGRLDDPDQSFDELKGPLFTSQTDWLEKRDGQWVAEMLGVDTAIFERAHNANATDQRAARAMHAALWPATLGYWMESMLSPVFPADVVVRTREFFSRFVIAGGICPAIRIGAQPYGILPATALSRMAWLRAGDDQFGSVFIRNSMLTFLQRLYPLLRAIDADFRGMLPNVSFVGKPGDAGAMLLDIVGLHPGSVEWSQRYAESLKTLFNRAKLQGFFGIIEAIIASAKRTAARAALTRLGYGGDKDPSILDLVFNGIHQQLKGGVVDDVPLSESERLRVSTTDGRNYLQWLIDASGTSLDALYQQQGFKDDKVPTALLYLFLRHALQLGYHDVSIRLYESAGLYDSVAVQHARVDDPFIHVRDNQLVSESRFQPLYAAQPVITGSNIAVHEFIAAQLPVLSLALYLREQRSALEHLKEESTARLERVFADHIDCCSYRLDAWLLGLVNFQLCAMRNVRDGVAAQPKQGVYLGAYAWLEDVVPENKVLTPVRLTDPELIEKFADPADPPLMRDSQNQGFVHAPSLNHAVAAAVLRNGFISNASQANRQTLAVNLTSERVRTGLAMIEGIRAGQSLSDLLGYQFERGLHDRHSLAEVDKFIYKLRRAFPIRADHFASTKPPEGVSIESIEARNVINGLALVEHIKSPTNPHKTYPFGKPGLPAATSAEAAAINGEVDRLLESHDAVADLALAEGVYQAVLGNYERVASTYDAYARGNFPPEPDVVRTPQSGIGLTHRVALHLESGVDPTISPVTGVPAVPMTPRAQGEPAINKWLANMLPALEDIACMVTFREAATGATVERQVTLRDLRLQPADLILLVSDDPNQAMTELDDRIVRHALANFGPRPDVPPAIRYRGTDTAPFSIFESLPLVRSLRSLTTRSRALRSSDVTLINEAEAKQDSQPFVDKNRLTLVQTAMDTLRQDLETFKMALDVFLANTVTHRGDIIDAVDSNVTDISTLLARAATFGVQQAGWGFAYDFKRRTFTAILEQYAARVKRWDEKLVEFNARLTDEAAATTDEARLDFLSQAERAISTIVTAPPPAVAVFRTNLTTVKQPAFVAKRTQLDGVKNSTRTSLRLLLSDVSAVLPISDFDSEPVTLTSHEDEIIRFAEDVSRVAGVVIAELKRRLAAVVPLFAEHDSSAVATTRLRALEGVATTLLGEGFRIIPEFPLSSAQGDELDKALNASTVGPLFDYLTNPPEPERDPLDFPVDTWMYGVARVREKVRAWEQIVMMSGALGKTEPELTAMQLPFIPDDRWLGLEVPPTLKLDTDRLLYTAHLSAGFDKTLPQCGLLLDEWAEMLPSSSVDTGITFHHDRPNCEAPQTMLLVTPTEFRGSWRWVDLVDALNETLDFAKRRAIEPQDIDRSPYGPFLPATVVATQIYQLTMALELGLNNKVALARKA